MSDLAKSFEKLVDVWKQNKKEKGFSLKKDSGSFKIIQESNQYYIEPTFTVIESRNSLPGIILISAVGASGKSTLAKELSYRTHSMLLDLAAHDAVGSNSLTGLIASTYQPENMIAIFDSLKKGETGIIIDGVDEGKAKTTPNAFFAFLDDIAKQCEPASQGTSFIILGRSNVIEDCFVYLDDKKINVELWQLDPFNKEQAQKYIDKHQTINTENEHYKSVCQSIFNGLEKALQQSDNKDQDEVLRFLGYAPVLDTISDIIKEEKNLFTLSNDLKKEEFQNDKILCDILEYLLVREKNKIYTNHVAPQQSFLSKTEGNDIGNRIYTPLEQAHRLISFCDGKQCKIKIFHDEKIQLEYEKVLYDNGFLSEHPFLKVSRFRNQVFESYILAKIFLSNDLEAMQAACAYLEKHTPSYYLIVFMLQCNTNNNSIPASASFLPHLLQSAMELKTRKTFVETEIDESEHEGFIDVDIDVSSCPIEQENETTSKYEMQHRHTLKLVFSTDEKKEIRFGNILDNVSACLPNYKVLMGDRGSRLVLSPLVDIEAKAVVLSAKKLEISNSGIDNVISINAPEINIILDDYTNIPNLDRLQIITQTSLGYPFYQCQKDFLITCGDVKMEHALRLRKILLLFRSHSRGNMARYCNKIEHRRVLKGDWGRKLLNQLLADSILSKRGVMYFISPERIDEMLEVNWEQLRNGVFSEKFKQYINRI